MDVTNTPQQAPSTPAQVESSAPIASTPAADSGTTAPTAPTAAPVVPTPAPVQSAPVAPTETKPAETAPVQSDTSVLGSEPKTPEQSAQADPNAPKVADVAPNGQQQEGTQSEQSAQVPTYEPFTLPEGLTVDEERLGEFTKELGEFELKTKADHAEVQGLAQRLVDRHVSEMTQFAERLGEHYQNSFDKQKADWKTQFENDPEIGGNRRDTTAASAVEFIKTHGGTAEQQQEFRQLMDATGLGNHPALIRLLATANAAYREGGSLPASSGSSFPISKIEKRYGKQ